MGRSGSKGKKYIDIDGHRIPVRSKEIVGHNILGVTVGTNYPQGGDSGHGGRTVLRFEDLGSTDLRVRVTGSDVHQQGDYVTGSGIVVELVFGGDSEYETLIKGLDFARRTLEKARASKSSGTRGKSGTRLGVRKS